MILTDLTDENWLYSLCIRIIYMVRLSILLITFCISVEIEVTLFIAWRDSLFHGFLWFWQKVLGSRKHKSPYKSMYTWYIHNLYHFLQNGWLYASYHLSTRFSSLPGWLMLRVNKNERQGYFMGIISVDGWCFMISIGSLMFGLVLRFFGRIFWISGYPMTFLRIPNPPPSKHYVLYSMKILKHLWISTCLKREATGWNLRNHQHFTQKSNE